MAEEKPTFYIDGNDFQDEDSFFAHFRREYIWVDYFGDSLNAFGELLLSAFNTGKIPYRLVWLNHKKSAQDLAADEFWKELLEVIDEYNSFVEFELR